MKLYMTKAVDVLFGAIGVIAACAIINATDLYYECSDGMLYVITALFAIATVWLKTAICGLAMKVLTKSISDRLNSKKETE